MSLNIKSNKENVVHDETIEMIILKATNEVIEKYNILLVVLNKILANLGKEKIKNACDFKRIKKEDIEKDCNQLILKEMKNTLEQYFDKYSIVLRNIKKEHMFLVYLKHMCSKINLNFKSSRTSSREKKNVVSYVVYSINIV